jgi:hypothetical protein
VSIVLPLAGVPRTCRVSESVENIQRHNNTRIKGYFLSLSYNAETILLREDEFADADVSEENTGMDSTYMRVGGRAVTEKELTVRTVADLSYLVGGGK